DFAAAGWPQAVGSSAPPGNLDLLLGLTDTRRFFAAVVTEDDVTRGKPDPEVVLAAAGKRGAEPPRGGGVEDAGAGGEPGNRGGMACVAVPFVGHGAADRLRAAGADLVVGSLDDVSVGDVAHLVRTG